MIFTDGVVQPWSATHSEALVLDAGQRTTLSASRGQLISGAPSFAILRKKLGATHLKAIRSVVFFAVTFQALACGTSDATLSRGDDSAARGKQALSLMPHPDPINSHF